MTADSAREISDHRHFSFEEAQDRLEMDAERYGMTVDEFIEYCKELNEP